MVASPWVSEGGYRRRSLNHVLDILEALHLYGPELGVTEIARAVGISKGAVHAILTNLEARGYVRRTASRRFQLGIKLWELGFSAEKELGIRDAAGPHLLELTDRTGESTHLSVYDAGEVLYLDKVSTPHAVQAYTTVGGRAPAYCVATGKALLAFQGDEEIARVATGLEAYTSKTIVDPATLTEALEEVRRRDYALNFGEWRPDVIGVAAPIRGFSGTVLAAVGVSGPLFRFPPERAEAAVPDVRAAARAISNVLGHPEAADVAASKSFVS